MSELNRTWVHPNAISYESKGVERPLHFFRHWQHLDFTIDTYTIRRSVSSQSTNSSAADKDMEFELAVETLITALGFSSFPIASSPRLRDLAIVPSPDVALL